MTSEIGKKDTMSQEKWIIDGPRIIDFELVRRVKVSLIGGKVDILTHDEPTARVEIHSVSGRELKVSIDGDSLEVDHPQLRWDNFIEVFSSFGGKARADVSILLPRNAALTLGVVSASALVSGSEGVVKLNTVSGDIVADGIVGDLDINSVTGEVSVSDHNGKVRARTVSGDVTVSGRLQQVSVDGVSADVVIDSDEVPIDLANNTVSGSLLVRLPRGAGARYTLNTVGGALQLDGLVISGTRGRGYQGERGAVDGEFVDVRANSVSGDITVIFRESPPVDVDAKNQESRA